MYKLKQILEDFIVKESQDISPIGGQYAYFELKKTNLATLQALKILAKSFNIPLKNMGYAGNKDKHAITTQIISIRTDKKTEISQENFSLKYLAHGKHPISLGDLKENYFEIIIRNMDSLPNKIKNFPNYFDEQRFSTNNAEIGKLMIKKQFEKATKLLVKNNHPRLNEALEKYPTNYVGAINKLPKKLLMIYLHSYQSLLFNELLANYIKQTFKSKKKEFSFGTLYFTEECQNKSFPLIGFNSELTEQEEEVLKKEGLTQRDFIIRQLPNLSLEGSTRKAFIKTNIKMGQLQDDELNKSKKKCKLEFSLPPGAYATMLIKNLMLL